LGLNIEKKIDQLVTLKKSCPKKILSLFFILLPSQHTIDRLGTGRGPVCLTAKYFHSDFQPNDDSAYRHPGQ
jgi:hypothetical protein